MSQHSGGGERILRVATRLFYAEGLGAIGVDRVVAESGVSKPTLYAQFGSKSGLIAAVLDRRREDRQRAIADHLAQAAPIEGSRVLALLDWLALSHAVPGFRGCPFTNAAVELPDSAHPARGVIATYKQWLRSTLADLAAADGLPDPEWWGSAVALLIDGANARVVVAEDCTAIGDARSVVARLISAARGTTIAGEAS